MNVYKRGLLKSNMNKDENQDDLFSFIEDKKQKEPTPESQKADEETPVTKEVEATPVAPEMTDDLQPTQALQQERRAVVTPVSKSDADVVDEVCLDTISEIEEEIFENDKPESMLLDGQYMRRRGEVRIGQRRNKFYTKFVRSMRIVLPLLAMVVVVVLVVLSGDSKDVVKAPPPKEEVLREASIGKNELLKPRFDTFDKKGRPYTITAERAFQTMDSSDVIYLEKPVADSTMSDGAWIALQSTAGTYNQFVQTLFLEGNVKLYHDAGYSLVMDKLNIDMKANTAITNVQVKGQGPIGTLAAEGMNADGEKNILIFNGPAKLVLYDMDNILE